jgi:uncharacterized protein (TIGR00730 family)
LSVGKKRLCVFCGAKDGRGIFYKNLANEVGKNIVTSGMDLVYGGAKVGLMGVLADAVLENGGQVIGVIPKSILKQEIAHTGLSQLEKVEDMHSRKKRMYDLSQGFLAIPGGFGTLDELFEVLTWNQLNIHTKPVYLLNMNGFFDNLLKHLDFLVAEEFLAEDHRNLIKELEGPDQIRTRINF